MQVLFVPIKYFIMDYRFTDTPEAYSAFFWGENNVMHPEYEYIFHLEEPRCVIKFNIVELFAELDDFLESIVEVQWLDGTAPDPDEIDELLVKAWNFMTIEDSILDADNEEDPEDEEDEEDEEDFGEDRR